MISAMREDEYYDAIYADCEQKAHDLHIGDPVLPRIHRALRRIDTGVDPVRFESAKQMFRQNYVELIDHANSAIRRRFEQTGMALACSMELLLICASTGTTRDYTVYTMYSCNICRI